MSIHISRLDRSAWLKERYNQHRADLRSSRAARTCIVMPRQRSRYLGESRSLDRGIILCSVIAQSSLGQSESPAAPRSVVVSMPLVQALCKAALGSLISKRSERVEIVGLGVAPMARIPLGSQNAACSHRSGTSLQRRVRPWSDHSNVRKNSRVIKLEIT